MLELQNCKKDRPPPRPHAGRPSAGRGWNRRFFGGEIAEKCKESRKIPENGKKKAVFGWRENFALDDYVVSSKGVAVHCGVCLGRQAAGLHTTLQASCARWRM